MARACGCPLQAMPITIATSTHRDTFPPAKWLVERVISCTAFFVAALSWSPLLPGALGFPFVLALLLSFFVFVTLTLLLHGTTPLPLLLMFGMLVACVVFMGISQSSVLLMRTTPIPMLAFMAYQATRVPGLAHALCRALTVYLMIGVVGALIGQAYALSGGVPLLTIANIDGRENSLYLTTMSNFNWLGVIRPAFIYDEPGAFSFLICATVALREVLGMRRGPSLFLLIGAVTTFSITHWIVTVIFLVLRFGLLRVAVVVALIIIPLLPTLGSLEELEFITERFEVSNGEFAGDNRSNQLRNFADAVDGQIVLFGDIECQARPEKVCHEHGDITSSPATPLYKAGLLGLIPQLVVHLALLLLLVFVPQYRFAALALTILLLQRPYFEISGYGFMTYLTTLLMIQSRRFRAGGTALRPSRPSTP